MSMPLGEEFIKVRPDASTFRTELQAQVAAALQGVQRQMATVQTQFRQAAKAATPQNVTAGGVVLPPGIRNVTSQLTQTNNTIANTGRNATATSRQLRSLATAQRQVNSAARDLQHGVAQAETAVGRYTRGMVAATAASTGFFRAVSFASGAFLLGATIGATIGAAVNEFAEMTRVAAVTAQLIRSTGGAANVTARQVDELSKQILKLTGIDDELVKSGANVLLTFRSIRNEVGQGNDVFNRAVKAAADISTVFKTDLRGSAVQLGKALQDPERGVTALRRSGITLTQGQRDLIKQLVRSGALLTAQKLILGEVERQVGRTAEAIGQTLPGRLRIAREEATNALGELVERLSESQTAAELASGATRGLSQAFAAVRTTVQTVGPGLVGIAQGLARATQAVGGVGALLAAAAAYKLITSAASIAARATGLYAAASASEAQNALVAARADLAAGQAALQRAQAAGTTTKRLEAQVAASAAAAATAEELAAAELTAARSAQRALTGIVALNAAFAVGAALSGQWQFALLAGGLAITGLVGKARAAVVALRATGTAITAMRVASLALGGPLGLAAAGVGALALAIFALRRDSAGSLKATKAALDDLNSSLETTLHLRAELGTARERFGVAQFDVQGAQRDLERAQTALANTRAQPGSLRFRFLQDQIRVAQEKLTDAQRRATQAQRELDAAREKSRIFEQGAPERIQKITTNTQRQIAALRIEAQLRGLLAGQVAGPGTAFQLQGSPFPRLTSDAREWGAATAQAGATAGEALDGVRAKFETITQTTRGASREAAAAILTIISTLDRLPTPKEINIIIRLSEEGVKVNDILRQLGLITTVDVEGRRQKASTETGITATLREQFRIAQGELRLANQKLTKLKQERAVRREALTNAKLELQAARDAVESAREGREAAQETLQLAVRGVGDAREALAKTIQTSHEAIAAAVQAVRDARTNLADTITQSMEAITSAIKAGRNAVNQSVQDAKGNLSDLNSAVADAINRYMEKTGQAGEGMDKRLRALRQQIIRGGGGPETLRAAQEVNFRMQAQTPEIDPEKLKQRFADLTDSFVRGQIGLKAFNRRFDGLLKGVNFGEFRKLFGSAATNEFRDTIRATRQQATAIAQGPQRIGGAIAQRLIKPLDAVRDAAKEVAAARKQASRDINLAGRTLTEAVNALAQARSDAADEIKHAQRDLGDAVDNVSKAERDVVKANRQLAAAERRLRHAQHVETQKNTAAVKANTKATNQLRIVNEKRAAVEDKQKPKGRQTQEALPFAGRH